MTLQQVPPGLRMVRLFKRHLDRSREQQSSNGADAPRRVNIAAYIGGPPLDRRRRLVQNPRFSVISNDCWGGGLYNHLSLMYRTPFVGVRVLAPCFIELLKDLGGHLRAPLEFVGTSRYDFMNERRARFLGFYPIALLRGSVEIHFVHEPDEETAAQNWKRRLAKMHWDNVFVKFSQDPEVCTDALLEEFDRLEYPYKVCFTLREYPGLGSGVAMPEYFEDGAPMYFLSRRFFDSISWLNKEHGPNTQAYRTGAPEGAVRAT